MQLVVVCLVVYLSSTVLAKDLDAGNGCTKGDKKFNEGEFYKANRLRYECKDGIMIPLGCYDDKDNEIEPGQDFFDKDKFKYNCYKKGLIVGYSYIPDKETKESGKLTATLLKTSEGRTHQNECTKDGKTYKENELLKHNRLRYQCLGGFLHVLGCYDDAGKEINPGDDFFDSNKLRYHCYKNGTTIGYTYLPTISGSNSTEPLATLRSEDENTRTIVESSKNKLYGTAKTCLHHTGEYRDGQEYRKDFLRWKCIDGVMRILGCYDHTNKDIEVGQNFEDEHKNIFRCYKKDRRIGYYWVPKEKELSKNLP